LNVRGTSLKRLLNAATNANSLILPIAASTLAIGIFVFDTITDLEIAVEVLYVAVVLISVSFCRTQGVILISLGCMALTLLSYAMTPNGSSEAGLINDGIGLVAIAATTFLALRIKLAERVAHEAKAQLAHVARVTTLGELMASIAHEVNQPLSATVTNGNTCLLWLAAQPPNLEEVRHAVERIISDANRASNVIARVRGLAKKVSPQIEILNINKIIQETLVLTSNEIRNNHVTLHTNLFNNLSLVLGDRVQLQQVILNLIVNAIEAMNGVATEERALLVGSAPDKSDAILVAIHDTGQGVASGKIDEIFDAFYSTKNTGLGMGLAISRSIIEAHKGRIWAEPNTPRGAVFRFVLPAAPDKASRVKQG
jgi:signal transduction histidine kinase